MLDELTELDNMDIHELETELISMPTPKLLELYMKVSVTLYPQLMNSIAHAALAKLVKMERSRDCE